MDKVQFQLESTIPELKDLHEKGLFTKNEINEITKRRTAFEMALIRRVQRKEDFFKYAQYEINLERLRRMRWRKLRYHINPPPPSASTYSIQRRTLYILKRATSKFPQDLSVWLTYIQYASREGMRKVVAQGLTKALQFHPTSSTLYLLQAYFHLHPNSPFPQSVLPDSTKSLSLSEDSDESDKPPAFAIEGVNPARTALLLGLRLVPTSPEIWTEYIKLELGWVEALRRRWKLLGIKDAFADKPVPERAESFEGDEDALRGGEGAFGPEGEDARKSILAGQLVIHALTSALKAIKPAEVIEGRKNGGMRFRERLLALFRGYPSPLRAKCLEVVHEELRSISIGDSSDRQVACNARLLGISRRLFERPYDESEEPVMEGECALSGVDLVEEYGKIAKDIRKITKGSKDPMWIETAGQWLIERINCHQDYPELRQYLESVASSLQKASK
ncbi:U3 small nucleolar RNA-associated protein 6 [Cryptococcus neoformans Ze90-1]|nr:U3 small nucleolar RNA-associated protein 6 [Cryptococcus neoformans var. grubii Ze90-1]